MKNNNTKDNGDPLSKQFVKKSIFTVDKIQERIGCYELEYTRVGEVSNKYVEEYAAIQEALTSKLNLKAEEFEGERFGRCGFESNNVFFWILIILFVIMGIPLAISAAMVGVNLRTWWIFVIFLGVEILLLLVCDKLSKARFAEVNGAIEIQKDFYLNDFKEELVSRFEITDLDGIRILRDEVKNEQQILLDYFETPFTNRFHELITGGGFTVFIAMATSSNEKLPAVSIAAIIILSYYTIRFSASIVDRYRNLRTLKQLARFETDLSRLIAHEILAKTK